MLSTHEFEIHGRVAFYGRANLARASLEDSLELMNIQARYPRGNSMSPIETLMCWTSSLRAFSRL
ncbi:unnamed protein product [Penicillium camemberti]|uniref:Str. FM013 n=1 Tax=Penicillium camemberti (strain FM 013) TaxID=1429867 RepID=A0A0G4P7T8_PENC3|nr:unnamed protein product [Penicillium camemberti]